MLMSSEAVSLCPVGAAGELISNSLCIAEVKDGLQAFQRMPLGRIASIFKPLAHGAVHCKRNFLKLPKDSLVLATWRTRETWLIPGSQPG